MIPTPTTGETSVYIHLPFCKKKCDYCHFFVLPDKEIYKERLHAALLKEIQLISLKKPLKSLYFGGGTPSLYGPERLQELIRALPEAEEVTLEANPDGLSLELLKAYKTAGVNRVSLGVQAFDSPQLIKLGRIHNELESQKCVHLIREAGFENITIDLMYDLPGQTLEMWKKTLETAVSLPITHLSLYNLQIEPATVFFKHRSRLEKEMPTDEESLKMYEMAQAVLTDAGLEQYEISAFAKPGYYSKHNVGYWLGREFYGLGPSAFSYREGRRYQNVANLNKYCEAIEKRVFPVDFEEKLEGEQAERELFLIGLRMLQGVKIPSFREELVPLEKEGLITVSDKVQLTPKGILLYDAIAETLV